MTVVLVHPIGLDAECWQLLDLSDAEAVEVPGHGSRRSLDGEPTLEGMADDVAAQIAELGGGVAVDVVGLSMGGAVAQHLALRHPRVVRSLVLACTSPTTNAEALQARAQAALQLDIREVVRTTLERWFTAEALNAPNHWGVGYARRRLLRNDPRNFAEAWRALSRHDLEARLREISIPATVVAATEDRASSREALDRLAALLPMSRLAEVAGPHMLQLEQPASLAEAIYEHLAWSQRIVT